MPLKTLILSLCALGLFACKNQEPQSAKVPEPAPAQVAEIKAPAKAPAKEAPHDAHVHEVVCACSLEKACANMIKVEADYVPLEAEGLGEMAFCGQPVQQAKVKGELQDGKFVASYFELLPKEEQK